MADETSNNQEQNLSTSTTSTEGPKRATSRLALLIAIIGAAFAAWIIIMLNTAG